jgi:hypothetical protein
LTSRFQLTARLSCRRSSTRCSLAWWHHPFNCLGQGREKA